MTTADLKKFKREIILIVLGCTMPFVLSAVGFLVNDHYKIKDIEIHKVSRLEVQEDLYEFMTLMETKNRVIENLARANKSDILHMQQQIEALTEINTEMNRFIREKWNYRGFDQLILDK